MQRLSVFKKQHPRVALLLTILASLVLSFAAEFVLRKIYGVVAGNHIAFNLKRLILILVVISGVTLTLYFGKKGREFVYKIRYLIGAALFSLCVAMQINYSSIGALDYGIQPSYPVQTGDLIFGQDRSIRSDEFVVSTPLVISQYYNNLGLINSDIMATDVVTTLYPKVPSRTPFSLLATPQYLGFLFLPLENAFSFYQLLPWFVAFFAVFEMLMIFTKGRKLMSCIGSFFIIFSPVVLWFDSVAYLMYVALIFDIFYLFIKKGKTWKSRLGISTLFGWACACFVMHIYPAWQVPYAYVLLAVGLYLLIEYHHQLKWKYLFYAILAVGVMAAIVLPNILLSLEQYKLTMGTVYPGQRFEAGGGGADQALLYISSIFYPISTPVNPCEPSGFISLFPLSLIIGIIVAIKSIKQKKTDKLLVALVLIGILFSFMFLVGNGLIAKLTLLYMTPPMRLRPVLDFVCVLIMIRILGVHQINTKNIKYPFLVSGLAVTLSAAMVYLGAVQIGRLFGPGYMRPLFICAGIIAYFVPIYCLLANRKQTNYVLGAVALAFAGYQFLMILPLKSGLDVYIDKPVATEIRKLSSENQEARWLGADTVFANYALANDARVINSTNYFPALDTWKKFDPTGKYEDVYNRYAHIAVNLTGDPTSFELLSPDSFMLHLNYNDVCTLNPTYFFTTQESLEYEDLFTSVYSDDGAYIYRVNCPQTLQN